LFQELNHVSFYVSTWYSQFLTQTTNQVCTIKTGHISKLVYFCECYERLYTRKLFDGFWKFVWICINTIFIQISHIHFLVVLH